MSAALCLSLSLIIHMHQNKVQGCTLSRPILESNQSDALMRSHTHTDQTPSEAQGFWILRYICAKTLMCSLVGSPRE